MAFCDCGGSKNTGVSASAKPFGVSKFIVLVRLYDDAGARSKILSSDTIDAAYLQERLNDDDTSQRWFPLGEFKNLAKERGDGTFETFSDNSQALALQGVKTFDGLLLSLPASYIGQLEAQCEKFGVYEIDECGNLRGSANADCTELYPIAVDLGSFYPRVIDATDTTVAKIQIQFNYSQLERDKNLRMILDADITADLLNMTGLLDINGVVSAITTTTFTYTASLDYGGFGSKIPVEGLVLADFELNELTPTAGAIVITSVTEVSAAVYDFVIPLATSADVLELTAGVAAGEIVKTGFEVQPVTITIP